MPYGDGLRSSERAAARRNAVKQLMDSGETWTVAAFAEEWGVRTNPIYLDIKKIKEWEKK